MDSQSARLYQFSGETEEEMHKKQKRKEAILGRKLVPLTEKQAKELKPLSKRERKRLLNGYPCPCGSKKSFKKCCWKRYT